MSQYGSDFPIHGTDIFDRKMLFAHRLIGQNIADRMRLVNGILLMI